MGLDQWCWWSRGWEQSLLLKLRTMATEWDLAYSRYNVVWITVYWLLPLLDIVELQALWKPNLIFFPTTQEVWVKWMNGSHEWMSALTWSSVFLAQIHFPGHCGALCWALPLVGHRGCHYSVPFVGCHSPWWVLRQESIMLLAEERVNISLFISLWRTVMESWGQQKNLSA